MLSFSRGWYGKEANVSKERLFSVRTPEYSVEYHEVAG